MFSHFLILFLKTFHPGYRVLQPGKGESCAGVARGKQPFPDWHQDPGDHSKNFTGSSRVWTICRLEYEILKSVCRLEFKKPRKERIRRLEASMEVAGLSTNEIHRLEIYSIYRLE